MVGFAWQRKTFAINFAKAEEKKKNEHPFGNRFEIHRLHNLNFWHLQ